MQTLLPKSFLFLFRAQIAKEDEEELLYFKNHHKLHEQELFYLKSEFRFSNASIKFQIPI